MAVHVLSLSYGKDSLACLGAIEKLGWKLDRIVHAEVWATDTIPADLPPMTEFKAKADKIIEMRWGIKVEHVFALNKQGAKLDYEQMFYTKRKPRTETNKGVIYGFPMMRGNWCTSRLKTSLLDTINTGEDDIVQYVGIACDEPERLQRLDNTTKISPLAAAGWTEADARLWCEENDLLSPIYTTATRGGCWFCHNQGVDQLRFLRKTYPELWTLLLKWDEDSPISFKPDGHTVHDYDRRFFYEDLGLVPCDRKFRWKMLDSARSEWLDALLQIES